MPQIIIKHENMFSLVDWIFENKELVKGATIVFDDGALTMEELSSWFEVDDAFKQVTVECVTGSKIIVAPRSGEKLKCG